jgi:NAD(P)-dependent dehydrogenase (short-subunit alcohol dehydrogenase family)
VTITGLDLVAVVTGSSSGNGRAIARSLAKAGAKVICADVTPTANPAGFETDIDVPTHEAIAKDGGQARYIQCDVTDRAQVRASIDLAIEEFGTFDVMVNNAGVFTGLNNIFDETQEIFSKALDVNVKGTWNGTKEAVTRFRELDRPGRVINMASVGGMVGIANEPGYCASKGAVVNFTRAVAVDCAPYRITVNAVCPGLIVTAMTREFVDSAETTEVFTNDTPYPRLGYPADVAGAVLMLCTQESEWMTGVILPIDGGYTAR